MVVAYPLWFAEGYAANVNNLLSILGGSKIEGVVAVVPLRYLLSAEYRRWRRSFASRFDVELECVFCLPDFGLRVLRSAADRLCSRAVAGRCKARGASAVHARGIRAAYLCCRVQLPVLVDVRGDAIAEAQLAYDRSPTRRNSNALVWAGRETRIAFELATSFVAVSRGMEAWIRESVGDGPRIAVIPCPVDIDSFTPRTSALGEEMVVGYLGGLQVYQSPTMVAEAILSVAEAAKVPCRAWVITSAEASELRGILESAGIPAVIERLDTSEIRSRLCQMDIGVLPREEHQVNAVSCPTKLGEYLAAGVPVALGVGLGEWATDLRDQNVSCVLDGNEAELAAFVHSIASDRAAIGARCRSIALTSWTWTSAIKILDAEYRALGTRHD